MARYFVGLKLRLIAAALELSWQQLLGFVLSIVLGVPAAIGGFALLAWLGGETAGGGGLRLVFTGLTILWIVGPPLVFGLDETLDPARLRLLPLTRRQLAGGLLAVSAVGVGPAVTLAVLAGAVVGFAPAGLGAPIVVAAVIAQFLVCLTAARMVTTVLSRWLRSRRGQDVLVIAGALLGVALAGLAQIPNLVFNVVQDRAAFAPFLERVETVVGLTPFAWAGSSVVAAADGRLLAGLGWLAATAALVALMVGVWLRVLANVDVTTAGGHGRADRDLFSGPAFALPSNRLGAAAARELRYQWRVPQLRAQWIFVPLVSVALVAGGVLAPGAVSPLLVFGICGLVGFQGFSAVNAFGGDRGAVWLLVAAGGIQRADLAGKNAAGALVMLPLALVLAVVVAAVTGGWTYVLPAILGAVAVLGCAYGVGNVVSTLAPVPLPESPGNVWASSSGAGCASALVQVLAMLVGAVILLPGATGVGLTIAFAPGWLPAVGVGVAAYGLAVWWLGLHVSTRIAASRGPEIVTALSKGA